MANVSDQGEINFNQTIMVCLYSTRRVVLVKCKYNIAWIWPGGGFSGACVGCLCPEFCKYFRLLSSAVAFLNIPMSFVPRSVATQM